MYFQDKEYFPSNMFSEDVIVKFSSARWWQLMDLKTMKKNNYLRDFAISLKNFIHAHQAARDSKEFFRFFMDLFEHLFGISLERKKRRY